MCADDRCDYVGDRGCLRPQRLRTFAVESAIHRDSAARRELSALGVASPRELGRSRHAFDNLRVSPPFKLDGRFGGGVGCSRSGRPSLIDQHIRLFSLAHARSRLEAERGHKSKWCRPTTMRTRWPPRSSTRHRYWGGEGWSTLADYTGPTGRTSRADLALCRSA